MKVRQNLYIDQSLSDALEALALRPGGNKSRIVNEALGVWLARRATKEVDDLLKPRSEEHTSDLQSLMRSSYAVFCLKQQILPQRIQAVYNMKSSTTKRNIHMH